MTERVALPAVVWDMGGILYRYFTEVLLDSARERGWDVEDLPLGPTGTAPDPGYADMEAGRIDEPAYLAGLRRRFSAAGLEIDPVADIDWDGELRPEAWRLVESLHAAGHPQALLTNDASKWLGERWWETWPLVKWFDAVVDVAVLGVPKPAPEPYLAAARALGLDPGDCLFVDDLPVNCAGAEAVGMASHHVDIRDAAGALQRLAARLGH